MVYNTYTERLFNKHYINLMTIWRATCISLCQWKNVQKILYRHLPININLISNQSTIEYLDTNSKNIIDDESLSILHSITQSLPCIIYWHTVHFSAGFFPLSVHHIHKQLFWCALPHTWSTLVHTSPHTTRKIRRIHGSGNIWWIFMKTKCE